MAAKILKLLCVFFSVVTVLLCGCDKSARSKGKVCADFSARFSGEYRGLAVGGEISNAHQGACTMRFDSPETLSGLCVRYRGGEITLKRGEVAVSADKNLLPARGFPELIRESLEKAAGSDLEPKGDSAYSLTVNGEECELKTDADGLPKSISSPAQKLYIEFTEQSKLDG